MSLPSIDPRRVLVGLDELKGAQFEDFAQAMFAALLGADFVPLGGVHDGGADGFVNRGLFQAGAQALFVQISIEEDHRAKIRKTVKRLREFGRDPESLMYITSRAVRFLDREEQQLGEELAVAVRIRDRSYITSHVNDSTATRAAFVHHVEPHLGFLGKAGSAPVLARSPHVQSPDVYVFLRQEVERNQGNGTLVDAVIDALILWALEGTDPDEGLMRTRDEVKARILDTVPSAQTFITDEAVNNRLQAMASKGYPGGRAVKWHRAENAYVLPYEVRGRIEDENAEDAALFVQAKDDLRDRVDDAAPEMAEDAKDLATHVALDAIRQSFEKEGLAFAHFLERKPPDAHDRITIQDSVADVLHTRGVGGDRAADIAEAVLRALRGCFYSSTEAERLYLSKLSRTYGLLFTLNTEPRLVEYLSEMTGNFRLYVGSDILVRAMSERYLPPADQMTRNMLRIVQSAGAHLILGEPVLEELINHLRGSDRAFKERYEHAAAHITTDIAQHIGQILIRAFFYAKNAPERHDGSARSWQQYVNQFCDYGDLHRAAGRNALRDYFPSEYGMTYTDRDALEEGVDPAQLATLTEAFNEVKTRDPLANHDAVMTLAVLSDRRERGESGRGTEFGYGTWWLTHEAAIIRPARRVLAPDKYEPFMMRPEFLLNFIALSPTTERVRRTFENVFPSMQGIRLSNRMDPGPFKKLMERVDEAVELEPGRRQAAMASLSDQLKSDFKKQYAHDVA